MSGSGIEIDVDEAVETIVDELDERQDDARKTAKEIAATYGGIEEVAISTLGFAADQGSFWEYAEKLNDYAEREDLEFDHPEKVYMDFMGGYHKRFFDGLYEELGVEVPTDVDVSEEA